MSASRKRKSLKKYYGAEIIIAVNLLSLVQIPKKIKNLDG